MLTTRLGAKLSICRSKNWVSGSDSGAGPGQRRGSLPVRFSQYSGASRSQWGVAKLRFKSTPRAFTRVGRGASRPSGLRMGKKRQCTGRRACSARPIHCSASAAEVSSSPCMAPTTSTRRAVAGAPLAGSTSRTSSGRPCTERPRLGRSAALRHCAAVMPGSRCSHCTQVAVPTTAGLAGAACNALAHSPHSSAAAHARNREKEKDNMGRAARPAQGQRLVKGRQSGSKVCNYFDSCLRLPSLA